VVIINSFSFRVSVHTSLFIRIPKRNVYWRENGIQFVGHIKTEFARNVPIYFSKFNRLVILMRITVYN
jgi:hypothetical protein